MMATWQRRKKRRKVRKGGKEGTALSCSIRAIASASILSTFRVASMSYTVII